MNQKSQTKETLSKSMEKNQFLRDDKSSKSPKQK